MRVYVLLVVLAQVVLVLATPPVFAQSTSDVDRMAGANQLYEGGRYPEAAQAYQQLVDRGHKDSKLYYNLGNAYHKQGELGRAILNYLRAEKLAPRDSDIRANLELARSQTSDLFELNEDALLVRLARRIQTWSTLNENAMAALGLWSLLATLLLVQLLGRRTVSRRPLRYATATVAVLFAVSVLTLGTRLYSDSGDRTAVVVAREVDVVSGPGSQYVTEFTLHVGTETDLLEKRAGWVRLALPGGELQGWVPATDVEEVESVHSE